MRIEYVLFCSMLGSLCLFLFELNRVGSPLLVLARPDGH